MPTIEFTCSVCKVEHIHNQKFTAGYARNDKGEKVCYTCCGIIDKEYMEKHGRIDLYLTQTDGKYFVSNWPGTFKIPVIGLRKGCHNIAGSRYDFQFKDHKGKLWYGVNYGENSEIARCRRYKNQN